VSTRSKLRAPERVNSRPAMSEKPAHLPNGGPSGEASDSANAGGVRPEGSAPCIVVVDDTPIICHLAEEILRDAGYEAHSMEDGYSALDFVRARKSPVHVLVTDLTMPAMDGLTLLRELRKLSPQTRTILMTGYLDGGDMAGRNVEPPDLVINKPFRPPELLQAVAAALSAAR
jgi:two-component system cell cycle sensor histidine kinase/response regulator CckA